MIKNNKTLTVLLFAGLTLLLAAGCLNNEWEDSEKHEQEIIKQYLEENDIPESSKTAGGIYFVEQDTGYGLAPLKDDYIVIDYVGRSIEGNSIHETTYDSLKDEWPASRSYTYYVYGPVKFVFGYSISGLNEGISMMREGGKATMVIPSDKAFYDFKPYVYDIELIKVIKDPVEYEDSVLLAYRTEKGFDDETTKLSDKNVWFKETVTPDPGDQRTVDLNDTVLLRFNGRLVDGFGSELADNRIFDANTEDTNPLKLVFSTTNPKVISGTILALPKGLMAAIDTMRLGTHATAVLKYDEAFSDDGLHSTQHGYIIVPKYQTVVYDIVVEDIRSPAR
jgi:FKBP-type peptidyl-prolyl cis-trans isomerase FkpA